MSDEPENVQEDDFPEASAADWELTDDDIADGNHLGTIIDTDDDADSGVVAPPKEDA